MAAMPLSQLASGAVARVASLRVDKDDATRLRAMGLCVGRQVELLRAGDPLIVRISGARIGLSARLAGGVTVEPA